MIDILSEREYVTKNFMVYIFMPKLRQMLKDGDPQKYETWQGNCCRQTAIFGQIFLKDALPDYDWQVWEGTFKEKKEYEHAWIFGKSKSGKRLLVDLSRNDKPVVFDHVSVNGFRGIVGFEDMVEISRKKIDVENMIADNEWYTQLPTDVFLGRLRERVLSDYFFRMINEYEN